MTKIKLDKPLGGWSSLEVDGEDNHSHVTLSYIDGDVATYILKELYNYLTFNSNYISLEFDGEEELNLIGKLPSEFSIDEIIRMKRYSADMFEQVDKTTMGGN